MTTDVNKAVCHQVCPRKRFLSYHLLGTGIERVSLDPFTVLSEHVRQGILNLLRGLDLDGAIDFSTRAYLEAVCERGLYLPEEVDPYEVSRHQAALLENALRGFHVYVMPKLPYRENINVNPICTSKLGDVEWKSNLDALLKPNRILRLVIVPEFNETVNWRAVHSMRTVSEGVAFRGETLLQFIVLDECLTHGYKSPVGAKWAFKQDYRDPHTGRIKHIGNDWRKLPVWDMQIPSRKDWVDYLNRHGVLMELFPQMIVNPPSAGEIKEWSEAIEEQESRINSLLCKEPKMWDWPMFRHSCEDGPCPYQNYCYSNFSDPLTTGEYRPKNTQEK